MSSEKDTLLNSKIPKEYKNENGFLSTKKVKSDLNELV